MWYLRLGEMLYCFSGGGSYVTQCISALVVDWVSMRAVTGALNGELKLWSLDGQHDVSLIGTTVGDVKCLAMEVGEAPAPIAEDVVANTQHDTDIDNLHAVEELVNDSDMQGTSVTAPMTSVNAAIVENETVATSDEVVVTPDASATPSPPAQSSMIKDTQYRCEKAMSCCSCLDRIVSASVRPRARRSGAAIASSMSARNCVGGFFKLWSRKPHQKMKHDDQLPPAVPQALHVGYAATE